MRRRLLSWTVESDPAATRRAYEITGGGAAARCPCAPCRNFASARPEHFPPELRELLADLGVDAAKEVAARLVTPLEGHRFLYSGRYLLLGVILAGRPPRGFLEAEASVDVFERLAADAHVTLRTSPPPGPPWPPGPCLSLELLVVLPWVIEAPEAGAIDLGRSPGRT